MGEGRIELVRSDRLHGEPTRLFEQRVAEGFWDKYVRPGVVIDIGYKGAADSTPVFRDAVGIDIDTPGYDGRNLPFGNESVGTIHASHLLEHIADYGFFFRECFRILVTGGTLLLFVPFMNTYERKSVPPSRFNEDHKRFYTAQRLLAEIKTTLDRKRYKILQLRECFRPSDLELSDEQHAFGPYEIECVLEKIA